jgi:hypothetical protein
MLIFLLLAATTPRHDKVSHEVAERLRVDRQWLQTLRVDYEVEPRYLMSEDAYHEALSDLEDYQDGDPSITAERLLNDALEVEMDLAPYRDSSGVLKY